MIAAAASPMTDWFFMVDLDLILRGTPASGEQSEEKRLVAAPPNTRETIPLGGGDRGFAGCG
jgi:hypothetical protein